MHPDIGTNTSTFSLANTIEPAILRLLDDYERALFRTAQQALELAPISSYVHKNVITNEVSSTIDAPASRSSVKSEASLEMQAEKTGQTPALMLLG